MGAGGVIPGGSSINFCMGLYMWICGQWWGYGLTVYILHKVTPLNIVQSAN